MIHACQSHMEIGPWAFISNMWTGPFRLDLQDAWYKCMALLSAYLHFRYNTHTPRLWEHIYTLFQKKSNIFEVAFPLEKSPI